jgi:hypothetical protein
VTRKGKALYPWALTAAAVCFPHAAAAFSSPPTPPPTCQASDGYAEAFGGRRTFALRPDELAATKASFAADPSAPAYRDLIAEADRALSRRPGSVMDKPTIPLSGDRHDYLSLAPYWWPDPADPKAPYVRRDGEVNPERATERFDRAALGRMASDVDTLALAYYYSGEPRYAEGAAARIRAWFLDPATAMKPHMAYAQAVPGRANGRAEGVLETSGFIGTIDAAGLIAPSGALSPAETTALERWFSRYIDWMTTSANGRAERKAGNNHGLWYDAQLARFALFARRPEVARAVVADFPNARIARQIDPSGALPHELTRTRSFHYSLYALQAAYTLADSAACVGVDVYGYRDAKGRSLRRATDYVAAYRGRSADWPYKELRWPAAMLDELLVRARRIWGADAFPAAPVAGGR